MGSSYLNPTTFNVVSNFALSQMSNCEYNNIHWFMTRSSHRIWWTIFIWIFFSCDYLLTRIIVYIHWKEKKEESLHSLLWFTKWLWPLMRYQIFLCLKCLIANTMTYIDTWLSPLIEYEEPSSFEYSSLLIVF